jgi:hypothetical protein
MPVEKIRNLEEEEQPLTLEASRDLERARVQIAKGELVSMADVMRHHGIEK